jgi:hypothetical protein
MQRASTTRSWSATFKVTSAPSTRSSIYGNSTTMPIAARSGKRCSPTPTS